MAERNKPPRSTDDNIDWFTISYRSIYTVVGLVALVAGIAYWNWVKNNPGGTDPVPAPSAATIASTARFTAIDGTVKFKPVGVFEWKTATLTTELRKNDLVRTSAQSTAEITFFDGTVVNVRPESLITIEETSEDPSTRRKNVRWRVDNGGVQFTVPAAPGTREVTTRTARATAEQDTSGAVQVAEGTGVTGVKIFRGQGAVTSTGGDTVRLSQGQGVNVDQAGKAGPAVTLPGTPELQSPPHDADITYPDPTRATTLLTWKVVPGATAYHVMLDYSSHFSRPLVDRRGYTETSVELRGLDAGKYYWRVSAVNKDGVEGGFSDAARFSVAKGGPMPEAQKPRLRLEPLQPRGFIVQIKGQTDPGATVSVNNQKVDVQADGTFNEFVTLDRPGRQDVVVRAVSINGGVSEERRSVVVGY